MKDSIKRLYKDALNDEVFEADMKQAEIKKNGNEPPGIFADESEKLVYSAVYYGYIVGKYGPDFVKKKYPE